MALVNNTANYDDKEPTNIRLEKEIKKQVLEDAERREITMADVINEILKTHYNKQ